MGNKGLLGALSELDPESIVRGNTAFTEFKGALAEQYVLQELVGAGNVKQYYFATEKAAYEVDFLYQYKSSVIPVEVKAESNLRAKSLRCYTDKYQPPYAVRVSMEGYVKEKWLINIPLYAVSCVPDVEETFR